METAHDILQWVDENLVNIPEAMPPFWIAPGQAIFDARRFLEVHANVVRQYSDKPVLFGPYLSRLSIFVHQYRDGLLQSLTLQEVIALNQKTRYPKPVSHVKQNQPARSSKAKARRT